MIERLRKEAKIFSTDANLRESIRNYIENPYDPILNSGKNRVSMGFAKKGETIYLLGDYTGKEQDNSAVIEITLDAIEKGLLSAAHTLSCCGLFAGLVQSCAINKLGFDITSDSEMLDSHFLFKNGNPSILISVNGEQEDSFVEFIYKNGINITLLGHVTKGELRVDDLSYGFIEEYMD